MVDVIVAPTDNRIGRNPRTRPRMPRSLAAGVVGGACLGVVARAWMRLISDDPEFSWSGTIFIVAAFTVFGLTQSVAVLGTARARRRWQRVVSRVVGTVGMLPIFAGAGVIMLPTVVGGGIATWRTGWQRWARAIPALVALAPVVLVTVDLVDSFGYSWRSLAGFAGLIAVYAIVVAAARVSFVRPVDGLRVPRWLVVSAMIVLVGLVLFLTVGVLFSTE